LFYQVLEWSCMVGAFAAFCFKLPALRRNWNDPALMALLVYFLCSALSFFLGLDAIWPFIARAFGYANITTILIHAIIVVLTLAQQVVLVYCSYQPDDA
jgi:hypothetical protein